MKTFKTLLAILLLSTLGLFATGTCTGAPTTEDITSDAITNSGGSQEIAGLKGSDCSGKAVNSFKIITLPDASAGVLYIDGVTAVTKNQVLTKDEAECLTFTPVAGFTGNASFTYVAIDGDDTADTSPATAIVPITAGACNEPTTEDITNDDLLNTLGAVNILNLAGEDCNGTAVDRFKIIELPDTDAGILYMEDGVTAVSENQALTRAEADGLKFDPTEGFEGNATFTYAAIDSDGNVDTTPATVKLPIVSGGCVEPTTEDIKNPSLLNTLGAVDILNLAGEDCNGSQVENFRIVKLPNTASGVLYMADGVTAVTENQTLTRVEADGLKFDPKEGFVGDATFTYAAIDGDGNVDTTPATVTIPLINNGVASHIVANPDTAKANGNADPITINVLANDTGDLNGAKVHLLNPDGTETDRLVVNGEGIWTVNADNTITFTPTAGFVGTPTPVKYLVEDVNGARSNSTSITITGQCVCEDYTTSVPTLSVTSLLMLALLISSMGIFFARREELN